MIQVNPDPDANDDAEIDIVKQIFSHSGASRSPSAPDIPAKFPDDRWVALRPIRAQYSGHVITSINDHNFFLLFFF